MNVASLSSAINSVINSSTTSDVSDISEIDTATIETSGSGLENTTSTLTPVRETTGTASTNTDEICISSSGTKTTNHTTYTNQWKSYDTTLNNTELPAYVFNSYERKIPEVAAIESNMKTTITSYLNGDCSIDDVKSCIQQAYTDIQNYNVSLGRTDGTNEADNAQILNNVYNEFVTSANMLCQRANSDEGDAIAASQGMDPNDSYVYYNSKYYYAFSDIKQAVVETTEGIASDQGTSSFSVAQAEASINSPTLGDFNKYWSANAQNNKKICVMQDTSEAPPENFVMFFSQSSQYADETYTGGDISTIDDGQLITYIDDQSYTYTVPFDYYSDNTKEVFNASDILSANDNGYSDYLKNFLLYRYYLHG